MANVLENARCGPLFLDEREDEMGSIYSISKYLIVAINMSGACMYELVRVGVGKFLGEIIRLESDTATIQLYEETSGLQIGDPVVRTKAPLSVELGPGILGTMYDGIQRPFEGMATGGKIFLDKGANIPALDRSKLWEFIPQHFKIGDHITGGDIFGRVHETPILVHRIMLPPKARGTITYLAPHGHYTVTETVLTLEFMDTQQSFTMMHKWAVRHPRPIEEKLRSDTPLFTGLRVYDVLFPMAVGGTCAIPGAYGCGQGMTCNAVAKYSNSDFVVHVGCGERGNELAEMLMEYPEVYVNTGGAQHSIMQRMCIIGNTSNMPIASREASIYTGITTAEYFRDQGYNATMLADSTSRWVEALTQIANNIPSLPASSGYPSYLAARLASFYERAGKVTCIGNPARTGSISILSTVSPPMGDFADPVCSATLSICQTFWGLDKKLAQRKHFPAVNCHISFSQYRSSLTPYFENIDPDFSQYMSTVKDILQMENDLQEIIELVGFDSLADSDRFALEVGKMIREDFLQQNIFSRADSVSPLYKTMWMLKNIVTFYTLGKQTIDLENATFTQIKTSMRDLMWELSRMKWMDPTEGKDEFEQQMKYLNKRIFHSFCEIE